ncbi:LysR family transcriptional regulator BsrA [Burkholderia pseudomallei]|uniref:LysR family transcriptional regulator BsrA n=1 Tax=Burkholderia pseudomallei TaxID=28450 RepID=UPI000977B206|nr:LysR family transcriptional regulator [Burkholderia pseudomallei]MBD2912334.1 LysR family transcriptional regulator [Burkholderia pseudomallei]MBD2927506.1 LysR family transcriptional regulator [Burkholderia pseudomallei]MBD2934816.1 LysR family transcriptional regulator [Burkholderia pseudomallei]MBD2967535.1 LysR family transcriptional regulator [Burkholderia pseudomallei]MBF3755965.1 LysR family transcriptional regulator [Burkholderia pseudomallei]
MIQNLRQLDLNLLLVFDALMQEQNLSRAAIRLHMSQPAVSNALTRLRQQLGEPLFTRTARGMTPTAQARTLYEPVSQALYLLQIGLGPQADFEPDTHHLFKLSMNDYGQTVLLPDLLAHIKSRAPNVMLSVQSDDAGSIPAQLTTGTLDLAIDYLHFDNPELCYEPLHEEHLVVIGRAGHPAFAGGLALRGYEESGHVSIQPRDRRGSPLEIVLGSARVRRVVHLQVPHYLTIPALVAKSDLLGTIPRRLAERFADVYALQIAPLPIDIAPIQVSLIWHRQQDAQPGLRWLREQVVLTHRAIIGCGEHAPA